MTNALCQATVDGHFKEGEAYPIVSFGETACLLKDVNGAIVGVSYADMNNPRAWDYQWEKT